MDLVLLAFGWTLWCTVHSLLISKTFSGFIEVLPKSVNRFYRLGYNIFSLFSFLAVYYFEQTIQKNLIIQYADTWEIFRIAILSFGVLLFVLGAKNYDMMQFMGFRQFSSKNSHSVLSETGEFSSTGLHNLIRHPCYSAAILLIWSFSKNIYDTSLVTKIIFTLYLIIGSFLEERKLILAFGHSYRSYQKEVSMLFPWKWILKRLGR